MTTLRTLFASATLTGALFAASLPAQTPLDANQREARDILRQLVNINSTTGTLGVKRAAEAMAARFRLAGFPAADVQLLGPKPELTALVVRYRGRATGKKPVLLMAHLDVVPAKRADWPFDPFVMQEKDGWYYGRGAEDDKAGVATIVATLLRYKRETYLPDRDLIAVFSADEETDGNSMQWLLKQHRALLDAEYALNADAGGVNLEGGQALTHTLQASEKTYANFKVEATNPGGHSSVPRKDNAIYDLSIALAALAKYEFPVRLNEVSRAYFQQSAAAQPADIAALMTAVATNPNGPAAAQLAEKNPYWSSVMRTTCVATLLTGGHADNALPQRATANVNCRMLPDDPTDSVRAALQRVMGSAVKVTLDWPVVTSPVSPLCSDLMTVVERLTRAQFPGATVVPEMSTGATDGLFTRNAGIPTYGLSAIAFEQREPSRAHGQEERVGVNAFHAAVRFWYDMVKALTTPSVTP
ncbi:MAG: M20/M25/M40 family metallo-hydrolase [Gemmatimonadaceae bacterium]|nr:M20/M25/M40 family metallo-hydrolase [Gemmatimonadaceae bacterium]